MPTLRVELFAGRTTGQKAALARALTKTCVRALGGRRDRLDVPFYDIDLQDSATGGALWSEENPASGKLGLIMSQSRISAPPSQGLKPPFSGQCLLQKAAEAGNF